LWAAHAIGRVLRAGVTSIAVPGGKWFTDVAVREAVDAGLLEGPRMVVAARALSNYGGIFDPDPYPAYEGSPADAAGVLCNTRDALTPIEAIAANTGRNAWLISLDGEIGVIGPGKLADIVIWNRDPTADITVLRRPDEISVIIKDGRIVDRAAAGGFLQLSEEPPRARMPAQ
jgi:Amidohydrolase family